MAATVAVMLYMELPRVAFEAQRDKEQLLIDRGEQYSRAVNLYVRKFNRYPADFDALQSTQNQRFLRHKYLDPMTGKDDWRIIHVGPGGVFTDSLVYGKKKTTTGAAEQQNFITEMQQTGGNQIAAPAGGVNVGTRQRLDQPGAPDPNNPNAFTPPPPPQFDANGQLIQNSNAQNPNPTVAFGQMQQGGVPGGAQQGAFGFPSQPQTNPNGQMQLPAGVQMPPGYPLPPGYQAPPTSQPFQGTQPANLPTPSASNMINQILTTPRPGGLNGLGAPQQATVDQNGNPLPANNGFGGIGGAPAATGLGSAPTTPGNNTGTALAPMQGTTVGGGMAGVASKLEQDGIKSYKDRTAYNEWEFVYDMTKDPLRGGGGAAPPPAPAQNGAGASVSPFAPNVPGGAAPGGTVSPFAPNVPGGAAPTAGTTAPQQ
jgi:hypothetical protein